MRVGSLVPVRSAGSAVLENRSPALRFSDATRTRGLAVFRDGDADLP